MKHSPKHVSIATGVLASFYFFGWLGSRSAFMQTWLQKLTPFSRFMELTPLNLLVTAGLLFYFHRHWNCKTVLFMIATVIFTFLIEMAGVQSGKIFGEYHYGKTLGWQLWQTPLIIGVNWLVLVYCSCQIATAILGNQNVFMGTIMATSLMTFLDYLIEPVAMHYNMWQWANGSIPLQNYVAWWLIGFLCCWTAFKLGVVVHQNSLAFWVYGFQAIFFIAM